MTEHPAIVDTEALQAAYGLKRPGDVERYLRDRNIRYFTGKKGPWTTVDALNAALGLEYKKRDIEIE